MAKKLTDQLIQKNEEYVKLRQGRPQGETRVPRETPARSSSGKQGHRFPAFERWTTQELSEYAQKLGYTEEDEMQADEVNANVENRETSPATIRQKMIDFINSRDATR